MSPTTTATLRVHPIPADYLENVRSVGFDVGGNPVEPVVAAGGEPLRCCLRDAEPGDSLILFGYEPWLPASPYCERGAVFAHAVPCPGPGSGGYPSAWRGRPQVLRAYDQRGWLRDAKVHDGENPESVIAELFADPAVVAVHSRNIAHGCYMFAVMRG